MKQALCIKNSDSVADLVNKKIDNLEAYMVDREICENPENGYIQIIPYVTFYSLNFLGGRLMFLQYQRKEEGNGEERLAGNRSIGFGGHIDSSDDIISSEIIQNENGSTSYKMTLDNILDTAFKCGAREVSEELGISIEKATELLATSDKYSTAFFNGDMSQDVNKVHLGLSIQVELGEPDFEKFKEAVQDTFNKEEIENVDIISLKLDTIIEQMDITEVMRHLIGNLIENNGLEDWSCRMVDYMTRVFVHHFTSKFTYKDLVYLAYFHNKEEKETSEGGTVSEEETFDVESAAPGVVH